MIEPSKVEYAVGKTVYGQPLRLVSSSDGSGWTLHREPANQRDDHVFISGLSAEVILKMAEAVKGVRHA